MTEALLQIPPAWAATKPPLFEAFPALTARVPWIALGHYPTRVQSLPEVAAAIGAASVHVKHDSETAWLYGGNKVRKLEFLLADAFYNGHRKVLTYGGLGSHHALATAVYAAHLGLEMEAVLFRQPLTDHVREVLRAIHRAGARLTLASRDPVLPFQISTSLVGTGESRGVLGTYVIPPGGSNSLSSLGYAGAVHELLAQVARGELPMPDDIFVATGSSGTAAGLVAGSALFGARAHLHLVAVTAPMFSSPAWMMRIAGGALELLVREGAIATAPALDRVGFTIHRAYFGPGYGHGTPEALAAQEAVVAGGVGLDTTYTGKAFAALLDLGRRGLLRGKHVLFWHTLSSAPMSRIDEVFPAPAEPMPVAFRAFFRA